MTLSDLLRRLQHTASSTRGFGAATSAALGAASDRQLVAQQAGFRCAALRDAVHPAALSARCGAQLLAWIEPLNVRHVRIHGAWDPLLRRIELFNCCNARTDEELLLSFAHELGHATLESRLASHELSADWFARAFVCALEPARAAAAASALRRMARSRIPSSVVRRFSYCPLMIPA